jgi:putative SOS response-associated peptidase YedK
MCFYNSQNATALALAKRYGRRSDVIEMAREVIEEQKLKKAFLHSDCVLVTGDDQLEIGKWGLIPFWIRETEKAEKIRNSTANAVSETVFNLSSFREVIRNRRCLIPSTGFYEYHHDEEKEAIPYRIYVKDEDIFSLAGVYDEWRNPETKKIVKTFSVLTVPANELCFFINNGGRNPGRMPVVLSVENEKKWLSSEINKNEIEGMMTSYPSELMKADVAEKGLLKR